MGKKERNDLIGLIALCLVCLLCGGLAFYYGAGALLLEEGTGTWETAEFGYRALYLAFGAEAPYAEGGFFLPKLAFVAYVIAFFAYFVALSLCFMKEREKWADYVMHAASAVSFLASMLFFFSHFAVPAGEGYFLIPGEGFLLPAALAMLPSLAWLAKIIERKIKEAKQKALADIDDI